MPQSVSKALYTCLTLVFIISLVLVQPGLAAAPAAAPLPQADKPDLDDIRFGRNSETGKLSFVGGDQDKPLIRQGEVGAQSVQAAAMTVIRRYAAQFGVQDPARNIRLERVQQEASGTTLRYQQQYRGVPLVGGEMVVNTDADGNVLSLNGEVSPDLTMASVTPTITAEQARQIALQGMQEWHAIAPEGAEATEPELWLYDERIFHESTKPVALVWRMEVTPLDFTAPVHEFVLVDARTGEIALHFNQVDTSWHYQEEEPTPTLTLEPAPTETSAPEPEPTEVPTAEPTPTFMPTEMPAPEPDSQNLPVDEAEDELNAQSSPARYVSTTGTDTGSCSTPETACKTMLYTMTQVTEKSSIFVAQGEYPIQNIYLTFDDLVLSGGWDSNFEQQVGYSFFDGLDRSRTIVITANNISISNLSIRNLYRGFEIFGSANIKNVSISNSRVGVWNGGGTITLNNITISSNEQEGIHNFGKVTMRHATIANNGIGIYNSNNYGFTIQNSIITGNTKTCDLLGSSPPKSFGSNILDQPCKGETNFIKHTTDRIGVNPKISVLVNHHYHPLLPGSPAIDQITGLSCPATDIRGVERPAGTACDIGSYEYVLPGNPASIILFSGSNQNIGTGRTFISPLQVFLVDQFGTPIPNSPVIVQCPSSGPGCTLPGGSDYFVTKTDHQGLASVTISANTNPGDYKVILSIAGTEYTASFSLTNFNMYVSLSGNDQNSCRYPENPCKTIQSALNKAVKGASIYVAQGQYTSFGWITKDSIRVTGNWNAAFTTQNSVTMVTTSSSYVQTGVKQAEITNMLFTKNNLTIETGAEVLLENMSLSNSTTAIHNSGFLNILNSTISSNKMGIYNQGSVHSIHTTFADNILAFNQASKNAQFTLQNSIISPFQTCSVTLGTYKSSGFNIVSDGCASSLQRHITDQIGVDPKISPLINTAYHALQLDSPAIDTIDSQKAYCAPFDQRGAARAANGRCDSGAFEYTTPGNAATIQVLQGSEQKVGQLQTPIQPLQVLILDQVGSPVFGLAVTFTAPSSGAGGTFGSGGTSAVYNTNQSGIASVNNYEGNSLAGSYTISATAPGIGNSGVFVLTNGSALYVHSTNGNDAENCQSSAQPCRTAGRAISLAKHGDVIYLTGGTYQVDRQTISYKDIYLSGGWNNSFTLQNEQTIFLQTLSYHQLSVQNAVVSVDRITFTGGNRIISNSGVLRLSNSIMQGACTAIYNSGTLNLINVTISNNSCTTDNTPGIHNLGNSILINVTITQNRNYLNNSPTLTATRPGGIFNDNGMVFLKNTILASNRTNLSFDCSGIVYSMGNNIISNTEGCTWFPMNGDFTGTLSSPVDARLAMLDNYGGNTLTHALLTGSPAIDAANPAFCPTHDQRGTARPDGSGCDIGAYEGSIDGISTPQAITFTANNAKTWPGSMLCRTPQANCTGGSNLDADFAHTFAIGTLQLFMDQHDRNGVDNTGNPILSTVHYGVGYKNAFWTDHGHQVVYGSGFSRIDDVAAHEIAHGITSSSSKLFYYHQSGAINESLSDLWGEYYDQINGIGNDADSVKWLIGEDLTNGAVRSMKNPPSFKDPDKMTSVYYYRGPYDNGGVHWNSGVNNKAIYLMVAGGTFNNRTVRGIGWKKTAAVYYYAQTRLLTAASNYLDLYHALDQACAALIGEKQGITADDCLQVRNAANAVEMQLSPTAILRGEAAYCPAGTTQYPYDIYTEDFEKGAANWQFRLNTGYSNRWSIIPGQYNMKYATSGKNALFGNDYDPQSINTEQQSDTYAAMLNGVQIPTGTTMMHFKHAFGFESVNYQGTYYHFDGGVVEYTIDDGKTWKDAKGLYSAGRNYSGNITTLNYYGKNPLYGRSAFVRDTHGFVSTRYNLTSLAGKTVRFRWRMGTDNEYSYFGWVIDDIRIYKCIKNPSVPALLTPSNGSLITNYQPKLDWKNASNANRYELVVARDSDFMDIVLSEPDLSISEALLTADLLANTRYYWRVRAFNEIDQNSKWSPTWSFRTALLPTGNLAPASGAIPDSLRPTFEWNESPGASAYNLIVSTYSNYSNPLVNVTIKGTSFTPTKNLPANKKLYWRVRATGTNPSAWSRSTFTTPRPAPAPALASPGNGARIYNYTPALKWKASVPPSGSPPLDYYELEISGNSDFTEPFFSKKLVCADGACPLALQIETPLAHNQRFYWRVRAVNTAGQFAWWSSRSFRTALFPPEIIAPAVAVVPDSLRPTFEWGSSPDAASYTLVVSPYANYSSPLVNLTISDTRYIPTKNLPANKKLYWRVRANGANPSAWASSTFTTPNPLPAPALVSPVNASRLTAYDPAAMLELKWKPSTASTFAYYHVQFNDSLDFSAPMYENKNSLSPSFELPPGLQPDRKYFWRVKTVNSSDQFAWWSSAFFTIPIPAPELLSPEAGQTIPDTRPAFDWTDVKGALSYTIVISTYANFSSPLINTKVTGSEYTATKVLPRGRIIYWRVRANGATGAGVWTPSQKFTIQ
jgi:Zn-dependent metalloprotease